MHITYISGKSALSTFRLNKLTSKLKYKLEATEIYLAISPQALDPMELNKLNTLICGQIITPVNLNNQNILITPRLGTTSPWSSKATEIVKRCGIEGVLRLEKCTYYQAATDLTDVLPSLHDQMTESVIIVDTQLNQLINQQIGSSYTEIDILTNGKKALDEVNQKYGLALSSDEIDYLFNSYFDKQRNPTLTETMMFAQANSEHCRHKIFNAPFTINSKPQEKTLFELIKDTFKNAPDNILVAYKDNSSVISGDLVDRFYPNNITKGYQFNKELTHIIMKVETHNHPTAISPFAGSATGSGGEIRDEGATGRGAKPKAGLTGFSVSNLNIKDITLNTTLGKPEHIKSALDIMLDAPIGGASFNNEFGRPNICGYFRSFEQQVGQHWYGYHKPIMLAGGIGNINDNHVKKNEIMDGNVIIQLGGPGFLIGIGGGSASSLGGGSNNVELDFNSVQRANPEVQRRAQEVINSCIALGVHNPIISIHDVGAGGLSNAVPELIYDSDKGGLFQLRDIPINDTQMSPAEIWCNESQERYVLAISPQNQTLFSAICARENCPYSVIGRATKEKRLILMDKKYRGIPVDIDIEMLFANTPKLKKDVTYVKESSTDKLSLVTLTLAESLYKVLAHPTVACKSFLITIGDRTVGGHTIRDQMVGPFQVPVANCGITSLGYNNTFGEVMAIGERTPVATLNAAASARLAIAESITNLSSAYISNLNDIKLSANWMASSGQENQDALLYEAVLAASNLCQELNIAIPVGKDSLSMKMSWDTKQVISPVSLIVSAFAKIIDVKQHKTPELSKQQNSKLVLISLDTQTRMGASILQECYSSIGGITPDVDNYKNLVDLCGFISALHQQDKILAYHDRSDGGLITTLCEMIFASRVGISLELSVADLHQFLFNEEIGVVLQINEADFSQLEQLASKYKITLQLIGGVDLSNDSLVVKNQKTVVLNEPREKLERAWRSISHSIQTQRDNPQSADAELELVSPRNTGLFAQVSFDSQELDKFHAPTISLTKPKVAIIREQGTNGHVEMAHAFVKAGFNAVDIHINDILMQRVSLTDFVGIALCGGFSYGDVLGAGRGFASTILFNNVLRDIFTRFFERKDTFALGVCNGAQVMAHLAPIIPGAANFPTFTKNTSEQFEARLVMAEITESPSIFFKDMIGSKLPIIVSHGEGFASFKDKTQQAKSLVAMHYIDNSGKITETYPYNPNGSPDGITAVTNSDGRFTLMMPHPERGIYTRQLSWHDRSWDNMSPWFKMFMNARRFVS